MFFSVLMKEYSLRKMQYTSFRGIPFSAINFLDTSKLINFLRSRNSVRLYCGLG